MTDDDDSKALPALPMIFQTIALTALLTMRDDGDDDGDTSGVPGVPIDQLTAAADHQHASSSVDGSGRSLRVLTSALV